MIDWLSDAMHQQGHRLMKTAKKLSAFPQQFADLCQECRTAWAAVAGSDRNDAVDLIAIVGRLDALESKIESTAKHLARLCNHWDQLSLRVDKAEAATGSLKENTSAVSRITRKRIERVVDEMGLREYVNKVLIKFDHCKQSVAQIGESHGNLSVRLDAVAANLAGEVEQIRRQINKGRAKT